MGSTADTLTTEVCVKRKVKDGWFVYTCDQLPGLYVAHPDDRVAYNDVPTAISMLVKLDLGMDCSVAHILSYSEFVRKAGINKASDALECRTQELIDEHDGHVFRFILQDVSRHNRSY